MNGSIALRSMIFHRIKQAGALLLFISVALSCSEAPNPVAETNIGQPSGSSENDPPVVAQAPGIGFGVSGLLFNNNLVLYDRARSDLETFDPFVLVPQMYFTSIEARDFPVYDTFPRDDLVNSGIKVDDINAINNPDMVGPSLVTYMHDSDMVIGLVIDGEARAYPHNLLFWHEVVNDQVGGSQVSVTFCPLTGTSLVFDSSTPRDQLLMLPVIESTWARWKQLYPDTKIVSSSNSRQNLTVNPYGGYESETELTFRMNRPVDGRFHPKAMLHGVLSGENAKGYLFSRMDAKAAINDDVAGRNVLVVYDKAGRMALSYDRIVGHDVLTFSVVNEGTPFTLEDAETGTIWSIEGRGLSGPLAGRQLSRIRTAYNAYWFAWAAFWPNTEVF